MLSPLAKNWTAVTYPEGDPAGAIRLIADGGSKVSPLAGSEIITTGEFVELWHSAGPPSRSRHNAVTGKSGGFIPDDCDSHNPTPSAQRFQWVKKLNAQHSIQHSTFNAQL